MLNATIIKGSFQDSVTLMVLSRDLSSTPGVTRVSIMMGTPANKDVYKETGLWHPAFEDATPNDLCIVVDSDDPSMAETMASKVTERLAELARGNRRSGYSVARSWRRARQLLPDANLALISIAGHYAFEPAKQALEDGCNVMMFSDNVPVEHEVELKNLARERGLLVMGPDCGTAMINGAPLAFANRIPDGPIAIVGASGTGIQEIASQIAKRGLGITHALGLGGRDLSERVGGLSATMALDFVAKDSASRVVAFVSKPPARQVKDQLFQLMQGLGKPVVALFLGERPSQRDFGNVHLARTLDEAAALAVELAQLDSQTEALPKLEGTVVHGLYTGGTLAAEAALLLAEALGLESDADHTDGFMLHSGGHEIVDLGDDIYTRGRPHPMIDPSIRNEKILDIAGNSRVGVLLLDIVLGLGAHPDPAGEAAAAVRKMKEARGEDSPIVVIATITGTEEDPQDRASQIARLDDAGIIIADSVREAVLIAIHVVKGQPVADASAPDLLRESPFVVNVGLRAFADDLHSSGIRVVHQQWEPVAGGNERLQKLISLMQ